MERLMNSGVSSKNTCWNYWKCSDEKRKACPIFKSGSNEECFILSNFSAEGCQDVEDCYSCSWYKSYREE